MTHYPSLPDEDQIALIEFLCERDVPCPSCDYNLRGLTTGICPECGNTLRLGVSLAEPYVKAWIALVVALLPPAGCGLAILISLCYAILQSRGPMHFNLAKMPLSAAFIFLHFFVSIPSSIAALLMRRWFMRRPRHVQKITAVCAWAAWAITLGCFFELAG
jgi:hypothetical protein